MKCHDCQKTLSKTEDVMPYEVRDDIFYKCKACHKKDPVLRNFQKCEVYSRIVGYYRPTSQWNEGKQEEFKNRKEFKINTSNKTEV